MTQTERKRKIRLSNQTKSGGNPMEKIVWSVWSCETPHKPSKIQRTCTFSRSYSISSLSICYRIFDPRFVGTWVVLVFCAESLFVILSRRQASAARFASTWRSFRLSDVCWLWVLLGLLVFWLHNLLHKGVHTGEYYDLRQHWPPPIKWNRYFLGGWDSVETFNRKKQDGFFCFEIV